MRTHAAVVVSALLFAALVSADDPRSAVADAARPPQDQTGHEGHGKPPADSRGDGTHAHAERHEGTATSRRLFQSDMSSMAGMTPRDPMADTKMPDWRW